MKGEAWHLSHPVFQLEQFLLRAWNKYDSEADCIFLAYNIFTTTDDTSGNKVIISSCSVKLWQEEYLFIVNRTKVKIVIET